MQYASLVSGVPFRQKPRPGQLSAIEHPNVLNGTKLNVKLPTGYGKTFTACCIYSVRQHHQLASRMLYIVPTAAQRDQFISSAPQDFEKAGISGPKLVLDIGDSTARDLLKAHRNNECQAFVTTIQGLFSSGTSICKELMEQGRWMVIVDEYHHYGEEKEWSKAIGKLSSYNFILAMSATPNRPNDDGYFGRPDVSVTYREAVAERAVKPLLGHCYDYRIDASEKNGDGEVVIKTYTTSDLVREAGGDSPDKIEKFYIEKQMRWSPKYVSPLVTVPIDRMIAMRPETGRTHLQVLISAMHVSHAKLVCEQVKGLYPELGVDWVGTGDKGRPKEENEAILKKFCPEKPISPAERRGDPTIDVLVHVGMAGEGLDTTNVSEVVFLRSTTFNNTTFQIIGRGARALFDAYGQPIQANISFDGSTQLASGLKTEAGTILAKGSAIMDALDMVPPKPDPKDPKEPGEFPPELPEEPKIIIQDMELINIDSGDEGVRFMAKVMQASDSSSSIDYGKLYGPDGLPNDNPDWSKIINIYKNMRSIEAKSYNRSAELAQWQSHVESAVSNMTSITIALMKTPGARIEKSLAGDIKKRINRKKKEILGPIAHEIEVYKKHYSWTQKYAKNMRETRKIPQWLI